MIIYAGNGTQTAKLNTTLTPDGVICTPGALTLGKSGCYAQFDLPSLCELSINIYMTGSRDLTVKYGTPGDESSWKTVTNTGIAKGSQSIDITNMASDMKRKTPMSV